MNTSTDVIPFIPSEFTVPEKLETDEFRLRMLTVNDVEKDYDAVISSVDHLVGVFGPSDTWPNGLTLQENLNSLAQHEKEFEERRSFAYTVMLPDESRCLGCVYVDPSEKLNYDAQVILWVRQSESGSDFEQKLFSAVKKWLAEKWRFAKVAFPGREIPWQEWASLPDKGAS